MGHEIGDAPKITAVSLYTKKNNSTMEVMIMRKKIRRILGVTLALALMCSVILPASAASVVVNFGSATCTVSVHPDLIQDEYGYYQTHDKVTTLRIFSASLAEHSQGNDSYVYYTGTYDVTLEYNITATSGSYAQTLSYLHELMDEEGMLQSYSASGFGEGLPIRVPANYPSGDYVAGIAFTYRDASWNVTSGVMINSQGETVSPYVVSTYSGSGRITYAPTGETEMAPYLV